MQVILPTMKRLATVAAGIAVLALPSAGNAYADGPRKVGDTWVVRYQHLDLGRPGDRASLLRQLERATAKACGGQRTRARREACTEHALTASLDTVPVEVRQAIQTALLERDGEQQARR
jgi:UrcA family protein